MIRDGRGGGGGEMEWQRQGTDWILEVPFDRLLRRRSFWSQPVPVVAVLAGLLLSYVAAPPLLWLSGIMTTAVEYEEGTGHDDGFNLARYYRAITVWIMKTVPRLASALLALEICLCFVFVGVQFLYLEESASNNNNDERKKR